MKRQKLDLVETIFGRAIEMDTDGRSGFLDEACAGDDSLRCEIDSLIRSHQAAGGFIEGPAIASAGEFFTRFTTEAVGGRMIGNYCLIREIGRGGMGAVYLAARADDEFQKQVAIKLVKRGLDTDDILRRFRNERQILAQLDHPNIARLLDGGTTEDGLPYFVMDYVEGETIGAYCDQRKLSTTERLRLFRTVCDAVQYAHQNLVIHRDIKPGNIIITEDGSPKLLDFGIAKLLSPPSTGVAAPTTATALRLMTPEYASPEQVRGETVTTVSDVYSLGVLLYELLTGHRPYRLRNRGLGEVARVICDEEPERPSTAVSRVEMLPSGEGSEPITLTPEFVSRTRDGKPDTLRRRLKGDIDNIVMKAMRKESQRRYASVEQFSEDIRRHLEGLPVLARTDTFGYRTSKFVRRHKAGVAAAALVTLALVTGIIVTTRQARIARIERAKAERINAFLLEMLKSADPAVQGRDLKVIQLLDGATQRVNTELADEPEVQAAVQRTVGDAYNNLGVYDSAEPMLRAALETQKRTLGEVNVETATTMHNLGYLHYAKSDFGAAEPLLRRSLEIHRSLLPNESREVVTGLNDLGLMLFDKGDVAAAEPLYLEALTYARKGSGANQLQVALLLNNLAVLSQYKGDLERAQDYYSQSIVITRSLSDRPAQATLATSIQNLAVVLKTRGQLNEAEPLLAESIATRKRILGERHPFVALVQIHLGDLYFLRGDYARAEKETLEALEIQKATLPAGHIDFARSLVVLGATLTRKGNSVEGEKHLREALAIRTKILPKGHWLPASVAGFLGECLVAQKRYAEAEPMLISSYEDIKKAQGEKSLKTTEALNRIASLYDAWKRPSDAAHYRGMIQR